MTNVSMQAILVMAVGGACACVGSTVPPGVTAAEPRVVGLAANDDLWVSESRYVYGLELYQAPEEAGDLWMPSDVPPPQASELGDYNPRLDRVLDRVTPTKLTSGAESQSLAF